MSFEAWCGAGAVLCLLVGFWAVEGERIRAIFHARRRGGWVR